MSMRRKKQNRFLTDGQTKFIHHRNTLLESNHIFLATHGTVAAAKIE